MQQRELIEFMGTLKKLKSNTRHVWMECGRRESVAEHSWRLAVMAMMVADEFPGIDLLKVLKMCLIHDFGEAITGDIPSFLKTKQDEEKETIAIENMLEALPENMVADFKALFSEMDELKTTEAKLYKALDRIEAVVSHNESPIETWLPNEYTDNIIYGIENAEFSPYLKTLREMLIEDSIKKIEDYKR